MKFKDYLFGKKEEQLDEVLITFGNRPRFGQVILLAGGAGSGKGFIGGKLIGIDAKTFDVDQIKGKIINPGTPSLNKKIMDKYGIDVTKMNLRNSDEVAKLHQINDEMGISQKVQDNFFNNLPTNPEKLPNVIFDTTMKSEKKIKKIVETVTAAGYAKENIHVIWVMNDANVAKSQNRDRDRVVPEEILMDTHRGVSETMNALMRGSNFQQYIDGYVYVVFNKKFVDSTLVFSKMGGSYVKEAAILEVKRRGKKQIPFSEIATRFLKKIKKYVPKGEDGSIKKAWGNF